MICIFVKILLETQRNENDAEGQKDMQNVISLKLN